ncbi:MAG: phenylalanine--tRNA ligase beta subunit, partial [Actinomycetota bacterium]
MKVGLSWLREYVDIPSARSARDVADAFIRVGFEVEGVDVLGADVTGPLVVARVLEIEELTEFKKPIRYCQVDVGAAHGGVRGIVCGARNFQVGDVVVAALPGAVLPGGFQIAARTTYERVSDGMLCSERELGLGEDHSGIIVMTPGDGNIGDDALALLGLGDAVLDVSVNPDRGYAMSVRGLARELALALDAPYRDPLSRVIDIPAAAPASLAKIADSGCTRFIAHQIEGLNPQAVTPRWMRNRLIAAGMRPVSAIVDVTNYVMLETGQPLHAYDRSQVMGALVARTAGAGEILTTIDHAERRLDSADLVIADDRGPLGLAGVIGGENSEISDSTTAVVLEAAHFDASTVAATCRRHRISTEASRRFERGVDPAITESAAASAAAWLVAIAGGTLVAQGSQGQVPSQRSFDVSRHHVTTLVGLDVADEVVDDVLRRVGCEVVPVGAEIRVTVPTWRPDLIGACDLSEEVARVVGYDQVPSVFPSVAAGARLTLAQAVRRQIDATMADLGWVQVMTSPFMDRESLLSWQLAGEDERAALVPLANPLSDEQPYMRSTVLPSLFSALERNRSRGFDSAALFERSAVHCGSIDSVQSPPIEDKPKSEVIAQLDSALPAERQRLAAAAYGDYAADGVLGAGRPWTWADAIDAAIEVCRTAGFTARAVAADTSPWHPGRCARIEILDGNSPTTIGYAGEVHPRVIESFRGPRGLIALELDLDALFTAATHVGWPRMATALVNSSVVKEDVALVVSQSV